MKDWTDAERLVHERGRSLMQSARDTRKARLEREERARKDEAARREAAQRAADEAAVADREKRIRAFMTDMATLLAKHKLSMNPMQVVIEGRDVPLFYLSDRTEFMGQRYLVNMRPGVGFNWNAYKQK